MEHVHRSEGLWDGSADYLRVLLSASGMGWVIGALSVAGLAAMLLSRRKPLLLIAMFVIGFAFASILAFPGYAEPRHQTPIYPLLAVAGAFVVVQLFRGRARPAWPAMAALLLLGLYIPLAHNVRRSVDLSRPDTRNVAKAWIERHLPSGSRILLDENGPELLFSRQRIDTLLASTEAADPRGQFTAHYDTYLQYQRRAAERGPAYEIHEIRWPWWSPAFKKTGIHIMDSQYDRDMGNPLKPVGVETYDDYVQQGFRYAVVSSADYGRFFEHGNRPAELFPAYAHFYRELFERGTLIKQFTPQDRELRGPVVRIYQFGNLNLAAHGHTSG